MPRPQAGADCLEDAERTIGPLGERSPIVPSMNQTSWRMASRRALTLAIAAVTAITLGLAAPARSQTLGPTTQPAIDPEQMRSVMELLRQNPEQMQALIEEVQQNPQQFMGLAESIRQNPDQLKPLLDEVRQNPGQVKSIVDRAASKNMQQLLGLQDEEWLALEPRIAKVTSLQAQLRAGGQFTRGMPFFFAASRPSPSAQSKLRQLAAEVARLGRDKDAPSEDVKAALESYRAAKAEVRASLTTALAELAEFLTLRQEAQLTLLGILESP